MKLIEGKSYKYGFVVFMASWLLLSVIAGNAGALHPEALAVSLLVITMVILQAHSNVALDQYWVASVSRAKNKKLFLIILSGQSLIAAYVLLWHYLR